MEEILTFLDDVLHNNNRPWFQEHKKQYQTAQANFNALAEQIITGVQAFLARQAALQDPLWRVCMPRR